MARITVEDCLTKETNRFGLVLLAAKRTKQLLGGARSVLLEARNNKSVVTALREIATGQVRFMTEEDQKAYEEQERERLEAEALSSPQPSTDGSDTSETNGSSSENSQVKAQTLS